MKNENTGGPAFPVIGGHSESFGPFGDKELTIGMSLRDYFAAKAMQSVIRIDWYNKDPRSYNEMADCIATDAYIIADAMLKVREE